MIPSASPIGSTPVGAGPGLPDGGLIRFLNELDAALVPFANGQRLDLYHLGRSALVSRYRATFSTKDVDVVLMRTLPDLEEKAEELFGKDSVKAKELNLYLDFVPQALPPLPGGFEERSQEVPGGWRVIRLWELEEHDLAATKLKRFSPQDREDLKFLCDQGLLQAEKLRDSLEKAFMWDHPKDGDKYREAAFKNLERVDAYLKGAPVL